MLLTKGHTCPRMANGGGVTVGVAMATREAIGTQCAAVNHIELGLPQQRLMQWEYETGSFGEARGKDELSPV